ncbi:MAG: lysophospholipid acyltransferase family protein [Chloroflexia bacterium]
MDHDTRDKIESRDAPHEDDNRIQEGDAGKARLHLRLFRLAIRIIFSLVFRVKVVGLANVPQTPVVACANHLGWTDPFLILLFLPIEPRIYILGEREVKQISGFRTIMINWMQVMVALDRDKPREALRIMQGVLERGGSLLLFPEGHLGKSEGDLLELQHGAAHLSVTSGVPLLPVGLTGTSLLWVGRRLVVRIGKPIDPSLFEGETRERVRSITGRLDSNLRALLPGDRQRGGVRLLRKWLTDLF